MSSMTNDGQVSPPEWWAMVSMTHGVFKERSASNTMISDCFSRIVSSRDKIIVSLSASSSYN
jgi:hypothetical protein